MSESMQVIRRRIREAQRRLFVQGWLLRCVKGLLLAGAVGLVWLGIQPYLVSEIPVWLNPVVVSSLAILGLVGATFQSIRRAPSVENAAHEIDQRFGLKERLTSTLAMDTITARSPVGQALQDDTLRKVEPIAVKSKFPIQGTHRAWLIPVQAIAIVLLLLYYDPSLSTSDQGKTSPENKNQKEQANLTLPPAPPRPPLTPFREDGTKKSPELMQLQEEVEQLLADAEKSKQSGDLDKAREQAEALNEAAERLQKKMKQQAERVDQVQEQLSKLERLTRDDKDQKNNPVQDFQNALADGDLEKAQKQAEKLQRELAENTLSPEEQKKLQEAMKGLQKDLSKLGGKQQDLEQLKKLIEQAKMQGKPSESLERELKKLETEVGEMKDLADLADGLKKSTDSLEQGDKEGAAKELGKMAATLGQLSEDQKDLEDKEALLGQIQTNQEALNDKIRNGMGGGNNPAEGKRPDGKPTDTKTIDTRQRTKLDSKGQRIYAGPVDGPAFTKKTTAEMQGEIQQAIQETPNAVDVQRLPRNARETIKEYFEGLAETTKQK